MRCIDILRFWYRRGFKTPGYETPKPVETGYKQATARFQSTSSRLAIFGVARGFEPLAAQIDLFSKHVLSSVHAVERRMGGEVSRLNYD